MRSYEYKNVLSPAKLQVLYQPPTLHCSKPKMSNRVPWGETSCLPLIYIQHYPFMITGFCFHTTSKSFLLQKTNTSIHGDCRYRCFRSCCKLPGFRWLAVRFTIRLLDVECYTNVLTQVFLKYPRICFMWTGKSDCLDQRGGSGCLPSASINDHLPTTKLLLQYQLPSFFLSKKKDGKIT